jgi:hypothetical protein
MEQAEIHVEGILALKVQPPKVQAPQVQPHAALATAFPMIVGYAQMEQQPITNALQMEQPLAYRIQVEQQPMAHNFRQEQQPMTYGYQEQQPMTYGYQDQQPTGYGYPQMEQQPMTYGYQMEQQPMAYGYQMEQQPMSFGYQEQQPMNHGHQMEQQPMAYQMEQQQSPPATIMLTGEITLKAHEDVAVKVARPNIVPAPRALPHFVEKSMNKVDLEDVMGKLRGLIKAQQNQTAKIDGLLVEHQLQAAKLEGLESHVDALRGETAAVPTGQVAATATSAVAF